MKIIRTSEDIAIEWATAQRAYPGESENGDLHLVRQHEHGTLLAVVDGIGHGHLAAHAARIAVETLRREPGDTAHMLVQRCHAALAGTRGVALTLALLNPGDRTITLCSVGNVEAMLFRRNAVDPPKETALMRGGIVGVQLPMLYSSVLPIDPGDVLVLATDGIRNNFHKGLSVGRPPQDIADRVLDKSFKGTDDACVLVTRFLDAASHE